MDIFLLPSRYEGLGIVLFEAQANGLKCYASDYVPKESSLGNTIYLPLKNAYSFWADIIWKDALRIKENSSLVRNATRSKASDMAMKKINEKDETLQQKAKKLQSYYLVN